MDQSTQKQESEESRREPPQAEGHDEEASEGLEQQAQQPVPDEGQKSDCRQDKRGPIR